MATQADGKSPVMRGTLDKVSVQGGVPLSQVHYHFGSKGAMVLLEAQNQRRLARQTRMYVSRCCVIGPL